MRLKKHHKLSKKGTYLVVVCAILLVVGTVSAAFAFDLLPTHNSDSSNVNLDEPTDEQIQTGKDIKNEANGEKSQTGSDPALPPSAISGSDKKSVNIEFTASNIDNSTLRIRTLIQYVTTAGSCTLTLTGPQEEQRTFTSAVQALPSSSTCRGFDIALSNLSPGEWGMDLNFTDNNIIGSTSSKITIP